MWTVISIATVSDKPRYADGRRWSSPPPDVDRWGSPWSKSNYENPTGMWLLFRYQSAFRADTVKSRITRSGTDGAD